MSQQAEYQQSAFLNAVPQAQAQYSDEVIRRKWNASGLGKPAELVTIQRWLRLGPVTKNRRFEPWLIGLAAQSL